MLGFSWHRDLEVLLLAGDARGWVNSVGPGGRLRLDSVELNCPVETLYEVLSEPLTAESRESERRP